MKKETLADKLARKTFESSKIQQSWQVHYQAFEPILAPAFVDNYQAKIHLTAALNYISNGNFAKGLPKLQEMQRFVETDADKAAYLFFMGLYCEMTGNQSQMVEMYEYANEYKHSFYLPYMKVAKFYQQTCQYDLAFDNYFDAIHCSSMVSLMEKDRFLDASVHTNMAFCLTMMHDYDDAMTFLKYANSLRVRVPNRALTGAILYAVIGEEEKAKNSLEELKEEEPDLYENVKQTVELIFNKTNPAFFPTEVDSVKIEEFWSWFRGYSPLLAEYISKEEYEEGMTPIAEKLLETFPFMEEPPLVALGQNEKGYVIELRDMYFVAVEDAFDKLLVACPENISEIWQFALVH